MAEAVVSQKLCIHPIELLSPSKTQWMLGDCETLLRTAVDHSLTPVLLMPIVGIDQFCDQLFAMQVIIDEVVIQINKFIKKE